MKDLYKRLGVADSATEQEIRAAMDAADPEARSAAQSILLDEHRRGVYDRNRRLLITVGQLRSRLGLSLGPFWLRGQFADFTMDVVPGFAGSQPKSANGQHLADPLEVLRAFDVGYKPRPRKRRWKPQRWLILLSALILLLVLGVVVAVWWQSFQYISL